MLAFFFVHLLVHWGIFITSIQLVMCRIKVTIIKVHFCARKKDCKVFPVFPRRKKTLGWSKESYVVHVTTLGLTSCNGQCRGVRPRSHNVGSGAGITSCVRQRGRINGQIRGWHVAAYCVFWGALCYSNGISTVGRELPLYWCHCRSSGHGAWDLHVIPNKHRVSGKRNVWGWCTWKVDRFLIFTRDYLLI